MIKDSFSTSIFTEPSKSPWIESKRSKEARFSNDCSSFLSRVTIAFKRNCCPFPILDINSRANKRPIRPNPYKTTSFGTMSVELFASFNLSNTKDKASLYLPSSKWYRSEEHTSELQSRPHLVCRLLLE